MNPILKDYQIKILKLLRNEFFLPLIFLSAYLMTSPYIYGWDDQHLEIPILKHLIDPSLYQGDYYVESAAKYFTSWLYPVLAKIITVKQIPAAYLVLFLISRYVMFYWVLRLWVWIGGSLFSAVCAVLMFFLLGRTDEFLYRSFCHEEFSFMFMFAGIYCFYRERYLTAAILFGLGVNTHAIYNLFPMLYMLTYLLFNHPQRFKVIFKTGVAFVIASLPFLCWQIPISISRELVHPVPVSEWMPLYLLACPQNLLFGSTSLDVIFGDIHVWWSAFGTYLFLMGLCVFHLVFNPMFRQDKRVHAILGLSWVLLAVTYYFDYVSPHRFVIDLNLIRVAQYMRFFLMGYTTIWACGHLRDSKPWLALSAAILVLSCATTDLIALFFLGVVSIVFIVDAMLVEPRDSFKLMRGGAFITLLLIATITLGVDLISSKDVPVFWSKYAFVLSLMIVVFLVLMFQAAIPWIRDNTLWVRRLLILVPLAGSFFIGTSNAIEYFQLRAEGPGPWEMLRDWHDMQLYVRDNTPKDAMIMTPYDMIMGGFRINSDRKVLVCYRDCGIVGFDYAAAVEWLKRIKDIEAFKIYTGDPVNQTVLRAILKYRIDYVVFMKYYGPDESNSILKKVYENSVFSLYQVL